MMKKSIKKAWNILTWTLVVVVVAIAVLLVGVRLTGLQVYTVLSGSMEPTYHVGSLIYVKKVDYKALEVGDPITFMLSEDTVATHRIIGISVDENDPDILRYYTQGDANDSPDASPVHYRNIIGMPVFTVPYLGYVANYIQTPPGMYIAIAVGALLVMLVFLPDLFSNEPKKKTSPAHLAGDKPGRESSAGE